VRDLAAFLIHYVSGEDIAMSDGHRAVGIRYAVRSDVGLQRDGNEDSAYAGSRLLAVADGLGGHPGGERASAAAIDALKAFDADTPAGELVNALEDAVRHANAAVRDLAESDPALRGMGTTLTAMLWSGSRLALVQIGDSRAYLLREGELSQITHDQTVVQALVDAGKITAEEALSHPQRSLVLQALDGGTVAPDLQLLEAQLGDRYLLCSDGLYGVVGAQAIHEVLSSVPDPELAAAKLIDLANQGGGPDNITCVVADVIELPEAAEAGPGAR
jgi:PPM family protein phosphatase